MCCWTWLMTLVKAALCLRGIFLIDFGDFKEVRRTCYSRCLSSKYMSGFFTGVNDDRKNMTLVSSSKIPPNTSVETGHSLANHSQSAALVKKKRSCGGMSTFVFFSHYHLVILSVTHCSAVIQNVPHDVTLKCTSVGWRALTAVVCLFHCCTVSQGRLCLTPGMPRVGFNASA